MGSLRAPLVLLAAVVLALAACSGTGPATTSPSPLGGHGVTFTVQVHFTGAAPIEGSFVDRYTGRGYTTCAQYAAATEFLSPGAVTGSEVVAGTPIGFEFALPPGGFHGPGTYSPGVLGRVTVGKSSFTGRQSSVTLEGDGSGQGSFSGFAPEDGTPTREAGTVSWTCAQ